MKIGCVNQTAKKYFLTGCIVLKVGCKFLNEPADLIVKFCTETFSFLMISVSNNVPIWGGLEGLLFTADAFMENKLYL